MSLSRTALIYTPLFLSSHVRQHIFLAIVDDSVVGALTQIQKKQLKGNMC